MEQKEPQSATIWLMPMRPLEPKVASVSSAIPVLEQPAGTDEKAGSPMMWMGILAATSPAIFTSAVRTDPQV